MKKIILVAILAASSWAITYKEASEIPSVIKFHSYTGKNTDKNLKKALKNKYWQNANKYLYNKTIKKKFGFRELNTIPFYEVMKNLKSATEQGILLAAYQGYDLSSLLSGGTGPTAKKYSLYFAKELMVRDVCLGYIEVSYAVSRGWTGKASWKEAKRIITAGKKSCENKEINPFIKGKYLRYKAQFSAMVEK